MLQTKGNLLPKSGTKVQHALRESRSVEAFLKHVISAMSYVARKGYFKDCEEAKRESSGALYNAKLPRICGWQLKSCLKELYCRSLKLAERLSGK